MAPFPILAILLLFISARNLFKDIRDLKFCITLYLIIFLSVLYSFATRSYITDVSFYFPRLLGWLLFPISIILFRNAIDSCNFKSLNKIINVVLIIHLMFFFTQYLLFHVFNYRIDFLYSIIGETQRVGATKLKEFGEASIRASGLFSEPGSYTVYIYIFVCIKILINKKIEIITGIALASMLLSFSMSGILLLVFILLYYLFFTKYSKNKVKSIFTGLIGLIIIIIYKADIILGPIKERILNLNQDVSVNQRYMGGYDYFFDNGFFLSGLGIGNLSPNIRGTSVILGGLYDLGIILLCLFLIVQIYYILKRGNIKNIFLLLPILASNISFNQVIYTLFIAFLAVNYNTSDEKKIICIANSSTWRS